MKTIVVRRSQTFAPGYCDLPLSGAELEKLKSRRTLGVTLDSKLTFETYIRKVVLKAATSLGAVRREGKLRDCIVPHVVVVGGVSFGFAGEYCLKSGKVV